MIYVNLDISTTGATGAISDPMGYDEFQTDLAINVNRGGETYRITGTHTYTSDLVIDDKSGNLLFEQWQTGNPPIIAFVGDFELRMNLAPSVQFSVTLRGLIIYKQHTGAGATSPVYLFNNTGGTTRMAFTIENCAIIGALGETTAPLLFLSARAPTDVWVRGNTFIDLVEYDREAVLQMEVYNPGTSYAFFDSNHWEGFSAYFLRLDEGCAAELISVASYNSVYNDPIYEQLNSPFGNVSANEISNDESAAVGTQLQGIGDPRTMDIPNGLRPIADSPIINTSNPDLPLTKDIFNIDRY